MPTTAFQSFEPALSLKNLEIPTNNTDVAAKRNIGRPRQAGAAAHACTEIAARNAPCRAFRPWRHSPCYPAISEPDIRHPHEPRRAAKPQGETGGRGGNYFPRIALTFPAARVPPSPVCPGHAVRTRDLHDARCALRRK